MDITAKEFDEYIINKILKVVQKSVPFTWEYAADKMIDNFPKPFTGIESHIYLFRGHIDTWGNPFYNQKNWLIENDLIRYVQGAVGQYLLTERGEKAKDFGDIGEFEKKEMTEKEQQENIKRLEVLSLTLGVDKLKLEVEDFPNVKSRSKKAMRWSIAATVIAGLTLIVMLLQWLCNKNG